MEIYTAILFTYLQFGLNMLILFGLLYAIFKGGAKTLKRSAFLSVFVFIFLILIWLLWAIAENFTGEIETDIESPKYDI